MSQSAFALLCLLSLPAWSGAAPTPEPTPEVAALLKPDLGKGWRRVKPVTVYTPATLFKYIDGEAEGYLAYGLVATAVGEYCSDAHPHSSFTVDLYDQGSSQNAFGVYASMRSKFVKYVDVGVQGFVSRGTLDCWKSRYFVHIRTDAEVEDFETVAVELARAVTAELPGASTLPAVCSFLPADGQSANTLRWQPANFLGYACLANAAVAQYESRDKPRELFVVGYKSPAEAAAALTEYRAAVVKRTPALPVPAGLPKDTLVLKQPYFGVLAVARQGAYLAGVRRAEDSAHAAELLAPLLTSIQKHAAP